MKKGLDGMGTSDVGNPRYKGMTYPKQGEGYQAKVGKSGEEGNGGMAYGQVNISHGENRRDG